MIDIHNHSVFGVDDGAQTIEESKAMLEHAYQDGIKVIVATPHYRENNPIDRVNEHYKQLCDWIEEAKLPIKLYLGNEAFLNHILLENLISGHCNTLANSQCVLIEFFMNTQFSIIQNMLYQLILKGYIPIIAHCERMVGNKEDLKKIITLKEMGCLLQVNARTILNPDSRWEKKWLHLFLKKQVISFIASDAHNMTTRTPELKAAYKLVSEKVSPEIAKMLFFENQKTIILSGEI